MMSSLPHSRHHNEWWLRHRFLLYLLFFFSYLRCSRRYRSLESWCLCSQQGSRSIAQRRFPSRLHPRESFEGVSNKQKKQKIGSLRCWYLCVVDLIEEGEHRVETRCRICISRKILSLITKKKTKKKKRYILRLDWGNVKVSSEEKSKVKRKKFSESKANKCEKESEDAPEERKEKKEKETREREWERERAKERENEKERERSSLSFVRFLRFARVVLRLFAERRWQTSWTADVHREWYPNAKSNHLREYK